MSAPIALAFLALQAVATAAAPPPVTAHVVATSAPADAQAATPPDPVMCQSVTDSGSFMPKKVCHRVSVWARMARGN